MGVVGCGGGLAWACAASPVGDALGACELPINLAAVLAIAVFGARQVGVGDVPELGACDEAKPRHAVLHHLCTGAEGEG